MEMSESIVFPCDTTDWLNVKEKLSDARNVADSSSEVLIAYLQKVAASVSTSSRVHDCTGARPKTRNIFADLMHCLDHKIAVEERDAYLNRILLHAVDRAIAIEVHRPSTDFMDCRQHRGECVISRQLAASIIACCFLGLYPRSSNIRANFDEVFANIDRNLQLHWMKSEIKYFEWLLSCGAGPDGYITVSGQVVKEVVSRDELLSCTNRLCAVHTTASSSALQTNASHMLQVLDHSLLFGGEAAVMQDVSFPEFALSCVLIDHLDSNEYLTIDSASLLHCPSSTDDGRRCCRSVEAHLCVAAGILTPSVQPCLSTHHHSSSCTAAAAADNVILRLSSLLKQLSLTRFHSQSPATCCTTTDRHSSLLLTTSERDEKCSTKSRVKTWQQQQQQTQSLSRGISFEMETCSSTTLMTDDVGTHRRGSLLQTRRGSTLHGQTSTSSESSSSSSERRRSSCLSDVSVRSSSSKRSSTGDFSSELDEYFDNVAHRSLQTAVIEEEVSQEHDAAPSSAASQPPPGVAMSGQHLLEHFVDNLMNEAAQQSKTELDQYLIDQQSDGSLSESRLEQFASSLAEHIVSAAVKELVLIDRQQTNWSDLTSSLDTQTTDQHQQHQQPHHGARRRIERQQTVSGFRDSLLSDFDKKLMSSHVTDDVSPIRTFTSGGSGRTRRASEPAYLLNTRTTSPLAPPMSSTSSSSWSVNYRELISSWFISQHDAPVNHCLTQFVDSLLLDAFTQSVTSLARRQRHRRHDETSRDLVTSRDAVPDVIRSYAERLTSCILRCVQRELSACAACVQMQSVAEKFATSIVDDVLSLRSASPARRLDGVACVLPVDAVNDQQLFCAVSLWIATSYARLRRLELCVDNSDQLSQMEAVVSFVTENQLTTAALTRRLLQWSSHSHATDTLLQFLLRHQ